MAFRSKWHALPTEAINPATLGIDKLSAGEIVDLMLSEDRKMIAAVQRVTEFAMQQRVKQLHVVLLLLIEEVRGLIRGVSNRRRPLPFEQGFPPRI